MALTVSQIRESVGAMMQLALDSTTSVEDLNSFGISMLVEWAIDYVRNGPGAQADRAEAMGYFLRRLYRAVKQADPDLDLHTFRNHFIGDGGGEVT